MARSQSWTVSALASSAGLDVDQVLLALWGEGIEYPLEPTSRIRLEDVRLAERTVGVIGSRQKRVSYWLEELSISRGELESLLDAAGARLSPEARTLPKGYARKLRNLQKDRIGSKPEIREITQLPPADPFKWLPPGNSRPLTHLTADEVAQVHDALTIDFAASDDPISPPGIKSRALLESAVGRPATAYGDQSKYPTAESAGAALLHSLVLNHPFHNGNKRSALVSMLVFLDRHNIRLTCSQTELFKFMVQVAAHDLLPGGFSYDLKADREVAVIAGWIAKYSRPLRREDRAVTWRELSRLLKTLDCTISESRGEWVLIQRKIRVRRGHFLADRWKVLEFRFKNTSDGREVPKSVLKRLRRELELDAEHGFDADVFYGNAKDPDYFILEYSQLLKRLARV